MKLLYLDTETTGLDHRIHGIIQIAAIMEIDGEVVDSIDIKCNIHPDFLIDPESMNIHGITNEEIESRIDSQTAYTMFVSWLDRHISPYDKTDKAYPVGFNINFDLNFLVEWFKVHGSKYGLGTYINWKRIDPLEILYIMDMRGKIALPNYKLKTVADHFAIDLTEEHDALADVLATRDILKKLLK